MRRDLAVVFMTAFAILVGLSQEIAMIPAALMMIAAVILEAREKRLIKRALQPAVAR